MKKVCFSILFVMLVCVVQAKPVDVESAKSLGIKFMSNNTELKSASAELVHTAYADNGQAAFYVFGVKPKGFVIVSADDRAKPILGYSTESNFSADEIPEGLQTFFANYNAGFSQMMATDEARTEEAVRDWNRLAATGDLRNERITREAGPLLSCIWNQSALYNDLCPVDSLGSNGHVYAGCVATAMSQIMYYWQWPTSGEGMHSYNCYPYGNLYAEFLSAEYRFDLMPDFLDWTSTEEEIHEVALLQYHAGVSVDMQYSPEGSGAYSWDVVNSLATYFKYDENMEIDARDWNSDMEWENKLRDNLDLDMPLYYSASGNGGGHAFVCDGYDEMDMFHFNWGWQGLDNGFYLIDGFYLSHYSFPYDHMAIFGIYPNYEYCYVPKPVEDLHAEAIADGTNRVTFIAPSQNTCDFDLPQIDTIIILRNGEIVHREFDVLAGSQVEFEDHDALGINHYTVYTYAQYCKGAFARDTILNGPTCEVTFQLHDSVGDGWIAKSISIVDSRGFAITRLGLAEGSEATVTVEVPFDEELSLHWAYAIGGKDKESSFELYDWDGNLIYATEGKPTVGELCRFTPKCEDGVEEQAMAAISVYPNPTRSQVTIEGSEVAYVDVYNVLGQRFMQRQGNIIDLSDLAGGLYLLRVVTADGQVWNERILKR